eukprot:TRINITY_DN20044_c1_g1_i3.p2 TRINITY_DN20044_c1_g1~~TRINITY_DN20044_c1_g1_i3.p2  ORF type:complete len:161 (-),score=17.50 TRINITY_DN20044_c1_g1_i3:21-503(-)
MSLCVCLWVSVPVCLYLYVCICVCVRAGLHGFSGRLAAAALELKIPSGEYFQLEIDPETDGELPMTNNEEFRPFSRKLPEFKFWLSGFRAIIVSIFMTFFEVFDLPVFWPILLTYFLLLVFLTMRDRIRHMMKYGYLPFSFGKKRYGGGPLKEDQKTMEV